VYVAVRTSVTVDEEVIGVEMLPQPAAATSRPNLNRHPSVLADMGVPVAATNGLDTQHDRNDKQTSLADNENYVSELDSEREFREEDIAKLHCSNMNITICSVEIK